ncbi:MAG: hypothetical protein IJR36_03755 [Lachnospiraceae bacterium]|nr:hypothetical protein [Lachnospiraceae bacterium]
MQPISEERKEHYLDSMAGNLKMLRSRAGLTQREISGLIGVSHQTYVNAEKWGRLSWNTYLSLLFLFEKEFAAQPQILKLMRDLEIYPEEYEAVPAAAGERWGSSGHERME